MLLSFLAIWSQSRRSHTSANAIVVFKPFTFLHFSSSMLLSFYDVASQCGWPVKFLRNFLYTKCLNILIQHDGCAGGELNKKGVDNGSLRKREQLTKVSEGNPRERWAWERDLLLRSFLGLTPASDCPMPEAIKTLKHFHSRSEYEILWHARKEPLQRLRGHRDMLGCQLTGLSQIVCLQTLRAVMVSDKKGVIQGFQPSEGLPQHSNTFCEDANSYGDDKWNGAMFGWDILGSAAHSGHACLLTVGFMANQKSFIFMFGHECLLNARMASLVTFY